MHSSLFTLDPVNPKNPIDPVKPKNSKNPVNHKRPIPINPIPQALTAILGSLGLEA